MQATLLTNLPKLSPFDLLNGICKEDTTREKDEKDAVIALDVLKNNPIGRITNDDELAVAKKVQSYLNRLYCDAFNRKYDRKVLDRISEELEHVQNRILNHSKSKLIKDKDVSLACRYLLSNRYLTKACHTKLISVLKDKGCLVKYESPEGKLILYVVGLKAKVGDNVFTPDRLGREHRHYVSVTTQQAFPIGMSIIDTQSIEFAEAVANLPLLDEEKYCVTGFGDYKGASRRFPVNFNEAFSLLTKWNCLS